MAEQRAYSNTRYLVTNKDWLQWTFPLLVILHKRPLSPVVITDRMQHTYGHSPGGIHNCFAWAEQAGYIWYDKQLNLWYITSMGYKLTGKNQPYPAIILFKKSGVNKKLAALAAKYNTGICDIVNPAVRAGRCILARGEFFWYLHDRGLPYSFIAERYNFGIERVREIVAKHKAITNRGKA